MRLFEGKSTLSLWDSPNDLNDLSPKNQMQ